MTSTSRAISRAAPWEGQPVAFWETLWAVPRLEIHESLGSTNDRARALAEDGWGVYTTVIADEQTKGRGRSGARWHSAPGAGLWMSVLLPAALAPHLPLLVGLATAEAIERTCPGVRARIEWPNDVTLGDRKVAGILCEGVGDHVVAGVGINVTMPAGGFPDDVDVRATALDREGAISPDRGALAGALVSELRAKVAVAGPTLSAEERRAISERDALEGRGVVTAQHGSGRSLGVAEDGSLVLERDDGRRVYVRAGRVRPAS